MHTCKRILVLWRCLFCCNCNTVPLRPTVVPAGGVTPLLSTLPPSLLLRRKQIIGGIVAATEDEARRVAKAVVVEYEDLPAIMSCEEAIATGSFRPYHGASVWNSGVLVCLSTVVGLGIEHVAFDYLFTPNI